MTGLQNLRNFIGSRLASGSLKRLVLTMGAAIAARLALLALAVLVGRMFGATQYGAFTFATGAALVAAQISCLGWPALMNRVIPGLRKTENWSKLRGLLWAGNGVVTAASLTAAAIFGVASQSDGELSQSFLFAALLVPPFAFCILRRQQMAAVRNPQIGMFFDQGFGAFVTIAILLVIGVLTLPQMVVAYAAATATGVIITTVLLRRFLPANTFSPRPTFEMKTWMLTALPIMVGMSSKLLAGKIDVLLLAPLSDLTQTGLYGAAWRLTYVLTFPQVVLMTLVTPAISEAFTARNERRARRVLTLSLTYTALTTLPFVIAILLFAESIIVVIFGAEFAQSGTAFRILAVGQMAASFAMVFSSIMVMGGRQKSFAVINLTALIISALLCIALIPSYGALGAAIAVASTAWVSLAAQAWMGRITLASAARAG